MRSFEIQVSGRAHRGTWVPVASDAVVVFSPYGHRKAYLDGRSQERAAVETLKTLVPAEAAAA